MDGAVTRGPEHGRNQPLTRSDLALATAAEVRQAIRDGRWTTVTHGLARGYVQANLAIVPERYAFDFMRFCHRNPKPCPLIDVTDPGDPEPRQAGAGADLRTDLSGYRVYRDGKLVEERPDIKDLWRNDHVGFLLGCSLSVDQAMVDAGIPLRHLETDTAEIPVYRSGIACQPAGAFSGPLVVSMRPIRRDLVVKTVEVTSRYPVAHGAPVHIGDASDIGIADVTKPDWSHYIAPAADEVPVFFACGVTPQAIAMASGVPEMITHSAGHMFITDWTLSSTIVN
ncbi:MAG: putative hydro-lyase [Alphaproteobacteria bacterium]|nr:putative hydro-lyase [Alphaproteobacteria bacterium]